MNADLADLADWFKANKLALNVNKSNYLLFLSSDVLQTGGDRELVIGLEKIKQMSSFKFLGITIDDKICWSSHLNYINLKLSRSVYILNSVKRMLPMPHLKTLYYTLIQPYLNYGITLWGATYQSYLKRTVILQKKAFRCIHKTFYNAPTNPLFQDSALLKLNEMYKFAVTRLMFDYTKQNLPAPILDLFTGNANIHRHNTRQQLTPHVTERHSLAASRSIVHAGPKIWSEMPQAVKLCVNTLRS